MFVLIALLFPVYHRDFFLLTHSEMPILHLVGVDVALSERIGLELYCLSESQSKAGYVKQDSEISAK